MTNSTRMGFLWIVVQLGTFCNLLSYSNSLVIPKTFFVGRQIIPTNLDQQKPPHQSNNNRLVLALPATNQPLSSSSSSSPSTKDEENKKKKMKNKVTLGELQKKLLSNPALLDTAEDDSSKKKKKRRRTRRRVENAQQTYLYAAQKEKLERQGKLVPKKEDGYERNSNDENDNDDDEDNQSTASSVINTLQLDESHPTVQARKLGLVNGANQHCDPIMDDILPTIMGQIRVGDETGSGAYAYIIDKPSGWSILGGLNREGANLNKKKNKKKESSDQQIESASNDVSPTTKKTKLQRVKIVDGSSTETLEFDPDDVLAIMTPQERAEMEAQGGKLFPSTFRRRVAVDDVDTTLLPGFDEVELMTPEQREEAGIEEEDYDPTDIPEFDEADVLVLMTPDERMEAGLDDPSTTNTAGGGGGGGVTTMTGDARDNSHNGDGKELDASTIENLKRIEARRKASSATASFGSSRPSVVSWLKELKAAEGSPIRGGNYWTAVAGATNVDDSGLVLLCPKTNIDNVFCDYAEYVAVVGNGKYLAPMRSKDLKALALPKDAVVDVSIVSKLRRGRAEDPIQTVRVTIPEFMSTSSSIVSRLQDQFEDGVRGDPAANPLDRRASRRLIHCSALSVSSLLHDDHALSEVNSLPDDIAILADRLNNHEFTKGSFLGRASLRENPLTNAYREINAAADGFPGWTVDRYGDWLFVQHDEKASIYRGPLPSIHDGKTAGVYYLPANPDRSAMGSASSVRPTLLEGKPAPAIIPIQENGITYHISLEKDLSTGIFLDQRLHRAWLARNCNQNTRILNCFAHCGGFSIAAAVAGASTVSLDLSKKWLDRVQPQLEANGVDFDERHDCIFGDCFEWLEKLGKRGERYDIVILDPPSTSVGKKKKRWSVKNDMDELVALAAPLVKEGGLLWTTTNSASVSPIKFARSCKKGFDSVGLNSVKLERIQPMPSDFPSIGPQPVKNLVWRLP